MATTTATTEALRADLYTALKISSKCSDRQASSAALLRLKELGLADTCSRCLGCGQHGPTSVEGGRCFKCLGAGAQMPRLTAKLVATAQAAVAAGALEAYFERNRLLHAVKAARNNAMALWNGTGITPLYSWRYAADATIAADAGKPVDARLQYHRDVADQNHRLSAQYDVVGKLADQMHTTQGDEAKAALAQQVADALGVMQTLAAEIKQWLDGMVVQHADLVQQYQQEEAEAKARYKARMGW